MGTIYYVCAACEEHNPEGSCFLRDDLRVMPDGEWVCEDCYDDAPTCNEQPPWSTFPEVAEHVPVTARDDGLDAKIRRVLSRLRDERGLGSRTLLAQEAAALIEQLAALNPREEARWLANAERQREEIDKSEVEFFEKLRAPPAGREG